MEVDIEPLITLRISLGGGVGGTGGTAAVHALGIPAVICHLTLPVSPTVGTPAVITHLVEPVCATYAPILRFKVSSPSPV